MIYNVVLLEQVFFNNLFTIVNLFLNILQRKNNNLPVTGDKNNSIISHLCLLPVLILLQFWYNLSALEDLNYWSPYYFRVLLLLYTEICQAISVPKFSKGKQTAATAQI